MQNVDTVSALVSVWVNEDAVDAVACIDMLRKRSNRFSIRHACVARRTSAGLFMHGEGELFEL